MSALWCVMHAMGKKPAPHSEVLYSNESTPSSITPRLQCGSWVCALQCSRSKDTRQQPVCNAVVFLFEKKICARFKCSKKNKKPKRTRRRREDPGACFLFSFLWIVSIFYCSISCSANVWKMAFWRPSSHQHGPLGMKNNIYSKSFWFFRHEPEYNEDVV